MNETTWMQVLGELPRPAGDGRYVSSTTSREPLFAPATAARRNPAMQQVVALSLAVLRTALDDVRLGPTHRRTAATSWFLCGSDGWLFSYHAICERLDLDGEPLRCVVREPDVEACGRWADAVRHVLSKL